jgi:hypothetical protein
MEAKEGDWIILFSFQYKGSYSNFFGCNRLHALIKKAVKGDAVKGQHLSQGQKVDLIF